ncbi:hypothetical protein [Streptomyces sp. NPDC096033]|uniref:hypothetical protein n=1 Tax=Streptomyces sp. NPDC096033 TaxID=3366071 RepID=UPI0037F1380C
MLADLVDTDGQLPDIAPDVLMDRDPLITHAGEIRLTLAGAGQGCRWMDRDELRTRTMMSAATPPAVDGADMLIDLER